MPTTTSGGTTTSFNNTPQAVDDAYSVNEDLGITYFDVMANDLGGKAKVLWSIDDTTTDGTTGEAGSGDGTTDLLTRDVAGVCEMSDLGARMWMTADGKIGYETSIFNYLAAGESVVDTFTYAIRLANGTLSWATVTVTITGSNDVPTVSAAVSSTSNEDAAGYSVDLLAGADDVDASDTLTVTGLTLTGGDDSGITVDGNSLDVDPSAYNHLAVGESEVITYSYTISDGNGGTVSQTATITIEGRNDAPVASAIVLAAIAEDSGGRLITQAELLAGSSDVDDDTLTVTALSIASGSGTLVDNGDGTWTYTPAADDDTSVTFDYTVSDGSLTDSSTASMDITPVDDFVYVPPTPFTGTGDPNDFDTLVGGAVNNSTTPINGGSGNDVITGGSASQTINGMNGNDTIYGGGGNDTISGGNDNDTLYGQAGNDSINGNNGLDTLYGGSGNDTLTGANDDDTLYGGSGIDTINGSGGNDTIIGGYGADILTGGSGVDTFRYLSNLDTGDTITDFSQTDGDKIDLSAFAPSSFVGAISQAGAVGPNQVGFVYFSDSDTTVIYVDTDGVFGADLEITLEGEIPLVAGDFLFGP